MNSYDKVTQPIKNNNQVLDSRNSKIKTENYNNNRNNDIDNSKFAYSNFDDTGQRKLSSKDARDPAFFYLSKQNNNNNGSMPNINPKDTFEDWQTFSNENNNQLSANQNSSMSQNMIEKSSFQNSAIDGFMTERIIKCKRLINYEKVNMSFDQLNLQYFYNPMNQTISTFEEFSKQLRRKSLEGIPIFGFEGTQMKKFASTMCELAQTTNLKRKQIQEKIKAQLKQQQKGGMINLKALNFFHKPQGQPNNASHSTNSVNSNMGSRTSNNTEILQKYAYHQKLKNLKEFLSAFQRQMSQSSSPMSQFKFHPDERQHNSHLDSESPHTTGQIKQNEDLLVSGERASFLGSRESQGDYVKTSENNLQTELSSPGLSKSNTKSNVQNKEIRNQLNLLTIISNTIKPKEIQENQKYKNAFLNQYKIKENPRLLGPIKIRHESKLSLNLDENTTASLMTNNSQIPESNQKIISYTSNIQTNTENTFTFNKNGYSVPSTASFQQIPGDNSGAFTQRRTINAFNGNPPNSYRETEFMPHSQYKQQTFMDQLENTYQTRFSNNQLKLASINQGLATTIATEEEVNGSMEQIQKQRRIVEKVDKYKLYLKNSLVIQEKDNIFKVLRLKSLHKLTDPNSQNLFNQIYKSQEEAHGAKTSRPFKQNQEKKIKKLFN